jgi:hypothetical protein
VITREMPDHAQSPAGNDATTADYDLTQPLRTSTGLRQNLTSYGDAHFSLFLRKVFIKALGYSDDALSRPIVGIVNTYSGFNPCHGNVPQLIEAVKRGVHLNGGLAVEFPTISVHESFATPTSMYLRNLMSMDTEEMIKAQPVDSVVLIGGGLIFVSFCRFSGGGGDSCCTCGLIRTQLKLLDRVRQDYASSAHGWYLCQQAHRSAGDWTDDAWVSQRYQGRGLY